MLPGWLSSQHWAIYSCTVQVYTTGNQLRMRTGWDLNNRKGWNLKNKKNWNLNLSEEWVLSAILTFCNLQNVKSKGFHCSWQMKSVTTQSVPLLSVPIHNVHWKAVATGKVLYSGFWICTKTKFHSHLLAQHICRHTNSVTLPPIFMREFFRCPQIVKVPI